MKQVYIAYCKCGGWVGVAVADTLQDQINAMPAVKRWMKKYHVEMEQHDTLPSSCRNRGKCNSEVA